MNKQLDHQQICIMARTGLSTSQIAGRLGCTRRHIRRVLKKRGESAAPMRMITADTEHRLWQMYRSMGESYAQIAYRFGRSRQAVAKHLNKNRAH